MAFAVAGQRSSGVITILDTSNVATSFPGFVGLARACGMQVTQQT
jgi:3-phosphoshikimate 1-carboxyvinyltransferase